MEHKMPDNEVWPPKPSLPDPLTEYDEVIAAKIAALSEARQGRLSLIKALRDEEGLDLKQALAVVNSYSDRHGVFVIGKAAKAYAWGGCMLALIPLGLATFNLYLDLVCREAILRQPHHRAAILALDREQLAVIAAMCVTALLLAGISFLRHKASRKK